jgi:hypothetical protein
MLGSTTRAIVLSQSTSYSCLLLLQYIVAVDIHNNLLRTLIILFKASSTLRVKPMGKWMLDFLDFGVYSCM